MNNDEQLYILAQRSVFDAARLAATRYRSLSRMCVLWVVNGGKDRMFDAVIQLHISANVAMHAYKKK